MHSSLHRNGNVTQAMTQSSLNALFHPRSIALIGASEKEGSVGRALLQNLITFPGKVYPVNPSHALLFGRKCFPEIAAAPDTIDLAIIATPAETVPGIVAQCVKADVRAAIILSAGFKEIGKAGAMLEREILSEVKGSRMRILGPNCLGIMSPHTGLNATFAGRLAHPGSVGLISQSGALCTAILDWSLHDNVGFSAFISVGSMLDVGWGDLIYHLGDDPHTKSIVIHMESVGDARSFLSAAREVALSKPIVVLKVGRTNAAAKAAASHTGALTGSDEVLDAAFRRAGVLRVDTISELFDLSELLAKQPRPAGPRLAIVTNAGGPGALAADATIAGGAQLAQLSNTTTAALNGLLPACWSHGNPVDVLGDAAPKVFSRAVELVAADPNTDGLLVILTPQAMTDPKSTAVELSALRKGVDKPLLASFMGAQTVEPARALLNQANIATYDFPDVAAKAFATMWRYSYNLQTLYETPTLVSNVDSTARAQATEVIDRAHNDGRSTLTEVEASQVLSAYQVPMIPLQIARTADEAVKCARAIGYPVVLKVYSEKIVHKTEVGGVRLELRNARAVTEAFKAIKASTEVKAGPDSFLGVLVAPMVTDRSGYELVLGSSVDAQFGPVLLFGAGGTLAEIQKDCALGLPPVTSALATRVMERTSIFRALQGVRGRPPVQLAELERLLVRFSQLVAEQPWIREIEVNPLLVSHERIVGLDARVILHPPGTAVAELPRLAIRPYPAQYVSEWRILNGPTVAIRPIRPEDEPLLAKFHGTLSDRSVYFRYFSAFKLSARIAHERLVRICFSDYDRDIALVADHKTKTGEHEILGIGRLSKMHNSNDAEFALLVSDAWQGHGLGTHLLQMLIHVARAEKFHSIIGRVHAENGRMQQLCRELGFNLRKLPDEPEYTAELAIRKKIG